MADRGRSAGYRQKRRALERSRRRRQRPPLTTLGIAGVLLVVGLYLGLGALRGGDGGGEVAGSSTTETTIEVSGDVVAAVLLRVTDVGGEHVVALLDPARTPSFILTFPPDTLIQASSGFEPLASLLDESDLQAATSGIEALTGSRPTALARVVWADLLAAVAGDTADTLPAQVPGDRAETGRVVARAVAALAANAGGGGDAIASLPLEGDGEIVRSALEAFSSAVGVAEVLPGRVVEGTGFTYYEPDSAATQSLLGGAPAEQAVSVEVQNGSGTVGIAQKVSEAIEPLGYTLLPPKNADAFPNVETTQIFAASGVLAEADRIRGVLGTGTVVKQDDLPAQRIVLVVGKDLSMDDLGSKG